MKNLKIVFLLVALSCIALVGCNKKDDEINNKVSNFDENNFVDISGDIEKISEEGKEEQIYIEGISPKLVNYQDSISEIKYFFDNEVASEDYMISPFIANKKGSENPFSTLGFYLEDINGDGVEEMLLYDSSANEEYKNVVVALYSKKSNESGESKSHHVLNSFDNSFFELCENDVLRATYNNENVVSKVYYKLDADNTLKCIEMVEYFENADGTQYAVANSDDDEVRNDISLDEANSIEAKYPLKQVEITPIF